MIEKIEYDNMLIRDSKCSMKYDGFAICVGGVTTMPLPFESFSFQMQYYHINLLLSSCSILF
jgi:hypothetical protein